MKRERDLYQPPIMTEAAMRDRFPGGELSNDCIKRVEVCYTLYGGGIVELNIQPTRFDGTFCAGYVSTANVGFIIDSLVKLLGIDKVQGAAEECFDVVRAFSGVPFRVYSWGDWGDRTMETVCIGHFMEDRFVWGKNLMMAGLPLEKAGVQP